MMASGFQPIWSAPGPGGVIAKPGPSGSRRSSDGRWRDRTPRREILEREIMKATYDARTDTLSIIFKADAAIAESDEDKPGVILDYDQDGNLVSLEILDASQRVTDTRRIEFETTG